MAKKKVRLKVEYDVSIEIDEDSALVNEFTSVEQLSVACARHHFGGSLAVIAFGSVRLAYSDVVECEIISTQIDNG